MQIRVLGPLEVISGDGVRAQVSAPMLRALLAALALRPGRVVSVPELAERLWGEELPPSARTTLRNYVMRLRKALPEDRIRTMAGGYQLLAPGTETDLGRFRSLVHARFAAEHPAEALDLLDEALGLWRGTALEDIGDCPLRATEQPRLEEMRLTALEERFELKTALGHGPDIVEELSELVHTYYLRERLVRQLMLALHRSRRTTEALTVYRTVKERLVDELGLEPGAELRRLHTTIQEEQPVADRPAPTLTGAAQHTPSGGTPAIAEPAEPTTAFPAAAKTVVARDFEIDLLRTLLATPGPTPPVCLIDGPGGVGKSTLAIHAARDVAGHYPDGLLYIDLHGADPGHPAREPEAVLRQLLTALAVEPSRIPRGTGPATLLYQERLRGRRVLILLDNAVDAEQVHPLLPRVPGSAAIVTSRALLSLSVDGHHLHLDRLNPDDAVRLLRSALTETQPPTAPPPTGSDTQLPTRRTGAGGADRPALPATPASGPADWTELAELCGQLPLALRIVATRMASRPHWNVSDWTETLRQKHGRMNQLEIADLSLRASLMVSVDQLAVSDDPIDLAAARLFPLLGAAPVRHFCPEIAAALADETLSTAEQALERLTDARIADSPRPGRYSLHDLLHAAAAWQANTMEPAVTTASLTRLARWYLGSLYRTNERLELHAVYRARIRQGLDRFPNGRVFVGPDSALRWTEEVTEDVLMLAEQLADPGYDSTDGLDGQPLSVFALHAAMALEPFCGSRLEWRYQERLSQLVLDVAERHGDQFAEAVACSQLGKVAGQREDTGRGMILLNRALELFNALGDRTAATAVASNRIACMTVGGQLAEAVSQGERLLAESRPMEDRDSRVGTLGNLAWAYLRQGEVEKCATVVWESYRQAVLPTSRALGAASLANYHLHIAEYEKAAQWAEQGLAHAAEQSLDPYTTAQLRSLLATALRWAGLETAAQAQAQQAQVVVDTINQRQQSNLRLLQSPGIPDIGGKPDPGRVSRSPLRD